MNKDRVPYRLATTVPAGGSGTLSRVIRQAGTIEKMRIRIYVGAELQLRLTPKLYSCTDRLEYPLIDLTGKQYIDGDDDVWEYEMTFPVVPDDELRVGYVSTAAGNLDFSVDIEIDHLGGTEVVSK